MLPQTAPLHESPSMHMGNSMPTPRIKASKLPKSKGKEFGISTALVTSTTASGKDENGVVLMVLPIRLELRIHIHIKKQAALESESPPASTSDYATGRTQWKTVATFAFRVMWIALMFWIMLSNLLRFQANETCICSSVSTCI